MDNYTGIEDLETVRLAWRDDEKPACRRDAEDSSIASTSTDFATITDNGFLVHKMKKMDTLAGLAVRYNVSLADLKRFNGLLSDTDLYIRGTLLVPTKLVPVGEDVQRMFAQIASGIGRNPALNNAEFTMRRTTSASRSLGRGDSYPPDVPLELPWWCGCGLCTERDESDRCPVSRNCSLEPGHVELMERRDSDGVFLPPTDASGPSRAQEKVRHRRRASDGPLCEDWTESSRCSPDHPEQGIRWREGRAAVGASTSAFFSKLGKAIGESALVQTMKKVASQPSLSGPSRSGGGSFREAADEVLSSVRQGLLPKGHSRQEWPSGRPPVPPFQAMTPMPSRQREGSKND